MIPLGLAVSEYAWLVLPLCVFVGGLSNDSIDDVVSMSVSLMSGWMVDVRAWFDVVVLNPVFRFFSFIFFPVFAGVESRLPGGSPPLYVVLGVLILCMFIYVVLTSNSTV